eukprot:30962-Pelagococcus_subviridis.AAC.10
MHAQRSLPVRSLDLRGREIWPGVEAQELVRVVRAVVRHRERGLATVDADATRRGGFDADRPSSRRRRGPRRRANCARRIEGGSLGAEKRHEYVYVYAVPDCASYDLADRIFGER